MATVASWILAIALGAAFALAGVAKVTDQPVMVTARRRLAMSRQAYRLIGVAEVMAAIGVILGLNDRLVAVGAAAALGLVALMLGAITRHLRAGDPLAEAVPAVAMLLLALLFMAVRAVA